MKKREKPRFIYSCSTISIIISTSA